MQTTKPKVRVDNESRTKTRIVTFPNFVWKKIGTLLSTEFDGEYTLPRKGFSLEKFLYYGREFKYSTWVNKVTTAKAAMMMSLCMRKLGLGIIKSPEDGSYIFTPLSHCTQEGLEELFEVYKTSQRYDIHIKEENDPEEDEDLSCEDVASPGEGEEE